MHSDPLAYFITFRTYGSWIPGDRRGTFERNEGDRGTKYNPPSKPLRSFASSAQRNESVLLSPEQRKLVESTIASVAEHRAWALHAVNVRSNHVHVVIRASCTPEKVMSDFKSWATRRLREQGELAADIKPWAQHGSTRYLFKPSEVEYAVWFTNEAQDGDWFEPPAKV